MTCLYAQPYDISATGFYFTDAEQFLDEGLFGDIPENIRFYLDVDSIARDPGLDYSEIRLNGINYICRCE